MAEKIEKAETLGTIEQQVEKLVAQKLAQMGFAQSAQEPEDPKKRTDYIKHGSQQHADMLGIRKALDTDAIVFDGYALSDVTAYGPQASEGYLREVLRQLVNELKNSTPSIPKNAPSLWQPTVF